MRGNGTATNEGIPTASLNGPVSPSQFFVECRSRTSLPQVQRGRFERVLTAGFDVEDGLAHHQQYRTPRALAEGESSKGMGGADVISWTLIGLTCILSLYSTSWRPLGTRRCWSVRAGQYGVTHP